MIKNKNVDYIFQLKSPHSYSDHGEYSWFLPTWMRVNEYYGTCTNYISGSVLQEKALHGIQNLAY